MQNLTTRLLDGRAKWESNEEKMLIDHLVLQVRKGGQPDNGFKSATFTAIQEHLKQGFGSDYSVQQIRSKYSALKQDFDTFTQLKNNSGFGWDEEAQLPTADDNVWEYYLQNHPNAKKFRKSTLKFCTELEELFQGARATGQHVQIGSETIGQVVVQRSTTMGMVEDGVGKRKSLEDTANRQLDAGLSQEVEGEEERKKYKRVRVKKEDEVAAALRTMGEKAEKLAISKTEQAVSLLQEEYKRKLSAEDILGALELFELPRMSEMFIAMKPGILRDTWLAKQIQKYKSH